MEEYKNMKDSQQKQSICGVIKILPKLDDILCLTKSRKNSPTSKVVG